MAAVALYLFWRIRAVVAVVILSGVLACAAQPIVEWFCRYLDWFSRRRWFRWRLKPHSQRTIATFAAYILLFAGLFWTVAQLISPFQVEFRKLMTNLPTIQAQLELQMTQAKQWYAGLPPEWRTQMEAQWGKGEGLPITPYITDFLKHGVGWFSHLAEAFLIPVLAFYFTLDGKTLRNQMVCLIPRRYHRQTLAILSEGGAIMRAYIISQFWLAVIAGVVTGVVLRLIGMEYAVILGLFAGITRAIPVIGPFIGAVPLTILAFIHGAQHGNPYLWIWVSLGFGSLHVFESKIIMPQFLGHALNLHAAIILIALLIGGEFFGLMGMFLAAPVAALIRLLLMYYVILPKRRGERPTKPPKKPVKSSGGVRVLSLERAVRHSASEGGIPQTPTAPPVPSPAPSAMLGRGGEPATSNSQTAPTS
jgi:predicted PurR-regulated permease PerM